MLTPDVTAAELRIRFEMVKAEHEADGPDATVPGSCRGPARYAVVTMSARGHGHFVTWAETLADAERIATGNICEGWQPVCYYDLATLAGEPWPASEGDLVEWNGQRMRVVLVTDDVAEGEPFHRYHLHESADGRPTESVIVDEDEVEILARVVPEERMPARYTIAKVVTFAVFNTVPQS